MKLLKDIISKKLETEEILRYNRKKEFALAEHICAYTLALVFLGLHDPLLKKKKSLWDKYSLAETKVAKRKAYQELLEHKSKEKKIIIMALNKMEEDAKSQDSYYSGNLWKRGSWGILSFERSAE